jgi:hypothetical protein
MIRILERAETRREVPADRAQGAARQSATGMSKAVCCVAMEAPASCTTFFRQHAIVIDSMPAERMVLGDWYEQCSVISLSGQNRNH